MKKIKGLTKTQQRKVNSTQREIDRQSFKNETEFKKELGKVIGQIMVLKSGKTRKERGPNRKTLYFLVRDTDTRKVRDRLSTKAVDVEHGGRQVLQFVYDMARRGQKYTYTDQQALRGGFRVDLIKAPKKSQSIEALTKQLDSTGRIDAYAN
jgi:hypothetical protein